MRARGRAWCGSRRSCCAAILLAATAAPPLIGGAGAQVVHFTPDETGTVYSLLAASLPVGDRREGAFGFGFGVATKGILGFAASIGTVPETDQTVFGAGAEVHPFGQSTPVGPFVLAGITQGTSTQDALVLGGGVSARQEFGNDLLTFFQGSAAAGIPLNGEDKTEFLGSVEIGLQFPIRRRLELAIVPGVSLAGDLPPGWEVALVLAVTSNPDDPNKPSDAPW